ncbi:MAG TPA: zinc-binding dehydrogenase [Alphaproteobacteria bacterium]|nr:zinc-binding dehydrogenase [Alphaproteobacteria bacterium]
MKAVRIHHFGDPDVIALDEVPAPQPAANEVLIRVFAASVNPVDHKIREGKYPPVGPDKLPFVLGRDVCGTVEGFGADVREFALGQEVYAMLPRSWSVLARGGILVSTLGQPKPREPALPRLRAAGYTAQPNSAELAEIARLIDTGKVKVVIDATFALTDARQAQERQERGHPRGKIVLKVAA